MEVRLQKILSRSGLGSRRTCEEYILAGRVLVNHKVATLGMKADPAHDLIQFDGVAIMARPESIYLVLNKPAGVLSSLVSQGGKPTIVSLIEIDQRVFPVGRLDLESEGLMLLTNDGELTHILTHPRYQHEKEYRLLLDRTPTERDLGRWRSGLTLRDGFKTSPAKVWIEGVDEQGAWVGTILHEGHKRQLREIAAALRYGVRRLIRVRFGPLTLGDLSPGKWRMLTAQEVTLLKASARVES
jgi:23S rRNA pseudouridine2605 synthase